MEIKGKVHCFFEQSGTFKNEFIKLEIPAEDYDIQNNFNETDHVIDLFAEIENAYDGKESVFDKISKEDLILAFFPCTYFSAVSQMNFSYNASNYKGKGWKEKTDLIIERSFNREHFFRVCIKLFCICHAKKLRLIVENPWNEQTFLKANFVAPPDIVDQNRMKRGDIRIKPTAYWFVECEPTTGFTKQFDKIKEKKTHNTSRAAKRSGLCSEDRSMIHPDYARNFIHDFILGKSQPNICKTLFD